QLLQLSTLELQEVVNKELLENPLLEEVTPDTPETPADAPVSADTPPAPTVEQLSTDPPPTSERQTDELPFDFNAIMSAAGDEDHEERSLVSQEDRDDLPFENIVRNQASLADHLEEQLRFASEDAAVRRIGTQVIGNLDEDGYLRAEIEEIAQRSGATAEGVGAGSAMVRHGDGTPGRGDRSSYVGCGGGRGIGGRQYVEQKLRSALWLIKSVDQRQRTLRKVTQSIVKFQREFLDRGLAHLRPLSLRDVGEDIGMHESTISRVTTNKYVETPQGLFELKFFFHSGIASGDGEMVSSVSVKKMIQDILAAEDPAKP